MTYRKIIPPLVFGLAVAGLGACEMIDFHPYDGRLIIDDRNINAKNIAKIEAATAGKDTVRFVLIGDTQRRYDETEDFVNYLNANYSDIDFLIHGGDFTEFGTKKEYEWAVEILRKLKIPYVGLIGNHDVVGNGDKVFDELFGADDFSFVAGGIKFVCLNTNAIEYDYSRPIPDFGFLKQELQDTVTAYDRTIVAMHARPGSEQFNNNVADVFQFYINYFKNLMCCLNAHDHSLHIDDLFGDGIIYYGCSCIEDRNFLLFTVTPDGYDYEVVDF